MAAEAVNMAAAAAAAVAEEAKGEIEDDEEEEETEAEAMAEVAAEAAAATATVVPVTVLRIFPCRAGAVAGRLRGHRLHSGTRTRPTRRFICFTANSET